jgi:hypothetical protein
MKAAGSGATVAAAAVCNGIQQASSVHAGGIAAADAGKRHFRAGACG